MERNPGSDLRAMLDRVAVQERSIQKTWMNRILQAIGPTSGFVAVYRRLGPKIDPWLHQRTGGRLAARVYGFPALLLYTTGAKTGAKRTSPLFYVRDGDDFAVVGTNFGTEHHPAWTGNLLKNGDAEILVGEETIAVDAQLADKATFTRLWPKFGVMYGGYDVYLEKLTHREPRMFLLHPKIR